MERLGIPLNHQMHLFHVVKRIWVRPFIYYIYYKV